MRGRHDEQVKVVAAEAAYKDFMSVDATVAAGYKDGSAAKVGAANEMSCSIAAAAGGVEWSRSSDTYTGRGMERLTGVSHEAAKMRRRPLLTTDSGPCPA